MAIVFIISTLNAIFKIIMSCNVAFVTIYPEKVSCNVIVYAPVLLMHSGSLCVSYVSCPPSYRLALKLSSSNLTDHLRKTGFLSALVAI